MLPIHHHRHDDPDSQPSDREVKSTIVARLRENPYTQDTRIKVRVHSGAVRLEGSVPTPFVRAAAIDDVETVPGVADLAIHLRIAA